MSRCFSSAYQLNPAVLCKSRMRLVFKLRLLNLLHVASATDDSGRELNLYDPEAGQYQLTDIYLKYRSKYLAELLRIDTTGEYNGQPAGEIPLGDNKFFHYIDQTTGHAIYDSSLLFNVVFEAAGSGSPTCGRLINHSFHNILEDVTAVAVINSEHQAPCKALEHAV